MREADLLVVGGGPAGLATAIHAHMAGLRAVVLDGARPPIDRACGEGVMPEGVEQLDRMGVRIAAGDRQPFVGIRYVDGDLVADGSFPNRPGLGIRRTALHARLVERAEELGVDLRWAASVIEPTSAGVAVDGGEVRGRWIVGADGRFSRVRGWAGLEGSPHRPGRFGVRRHFHVEPWSDRVEVHWGPGCEAYVTPVGPDLVGVALMWSGRAGGFDAVLQRLPGLAERLTRARVASRDAGAGPFGARARAVAGGRYALVGDAACCLDPITGEGISLALQASDALVSAMVSENLDRYRTAHARLVRTPARINRMVLLLGRFPDLRRRVIRTLARRPELFDRLIATRRGSGAGAGGALLRLSWRLLAAGP